MNDYLLATILGIVEGLTEFLPVSSTAHLRIVEALAGIDLSNGYWKMFSIVIQLGAILCLPFYFRQRIAKFLTTFPSGTGGKKTIFTHPLSLMMLAFTCTALPALLLTKIIGQHLESLIIIGSALLIGSVVMWLVDFIYGKPRSLPNGRVGYSTERMEDMSLAQAVWIGLCQLTSAVFPGTSRSMSTIAAGQLAGMSRPAALEFSFLISIPTMVAATLYDLYKSLQPGATNPIGTTHVDPRGWGLLVIGFMISFVVAYGVVAWFMKWVRNRGFAAFAVYRLILGTAVLWWALK